MARDSAAASLFLHSAAGETKSNRFVPDVSRFVRSLRKKHYFFESNFNSTFLAAGDRILALRTVRRFSVWCPATVMTPRLLMIFVFVRWIPVRLSFHRQPRESGQFQGIPYETSLASPFIWILGCTNQIFKCFSHLLARRLGFLMHIHLLNVCRINYVETREFR